MRRTPAINPSENCMSSQSQTSLRSGSRGPKCRFSLFQENNIVRVPVIDENTLVGIISRKGVDDHRKIQSQTDVPRRGSR
jgi:predicted transcriptional regulator